MNRREVLAGLGALTAGGLASAAEGATPEAPRNGGALRLVLAGASTRDSLDPRTWDNSVMIVLARGLYNGLIELGEDGRAKPELALGWEPRNGAREWAFSLRKGVHFASGREFNADDAIYSLNLHRGDGRSNGRVALAAVVEMRKIDARQIVVSLNAPDADFPLALTDPRLVMVPDGFRDWRQPQGTGAFRLDAFEPGVRALLRKNPDFWKDGRGHVESAEINVISDANARLASLKSGQSDIMNRLDPRLASGLEKSPTLKIVRATGGAHFVAAMATEAAPLDSPDLRAALKYAVDRDALVKTLFNGYGARGADHPVPPGDPYFNSELPPRRHDPDRAAAALRKAGFGGALRLEACEGSRASDFARACAGPCAASGVKVDAHASPSDRFWEQIWLKAPFVANEWAGRSSALEHLMLVYGSAGPLNETRWSNERFDKLIAQARMETDEARRKPLMWEMQTLLANDGGAVIPVFRDWLDARQDRVGGLLPHSGGELANGYVLERAWLRA